jgi:hypothetical protein
LNLYKKAGNSSFILHPFSQHPNSFITPRHQLTTSTHSAYSNTNITIKMKMQITQVLAILAATANAAPSPQIAPAVTQSYVKVGEGSPRQAYLYEQSTVSLYRPSQRS